MEIKLREIVALCSAEWPRQGTALKEIRAIISPMLLKMQLDAQIKKEDENG